MEANCKILPPLNLNCWKHHAFFIKEQINSIRSSKEVEEIQKCLLKIGESQMDLYCGSLTPIEVSESVIEILKKGKVLLLDEYIDWLKQYGRDYQLIKLNDNSTWTLRLGENPERYVHIHPGRYSKHTIRVKATTLKTAILILCFEQIGGASLFNTESVNDIRKKYLDEPPLKSLSKASGLIRLLDLFRNKI